MTRILAEAGSFREAAPQILQIVCEGLDWRLGQVWRVDYDKDVLAFVGAWHAPSKEVEQFVAANRDVTFRREEGLPGRVWASGAAAWIDDVVEDPNFPRAALATRADLHAGFAAPIAASGATLGVLEFFSSEPRDPDEDLLGIMASIGSQIGQFVNRRRAELDLRESRDELEAILRSVREGIVVERRGGQFDFANEAAAHLLGCESVDELLRMSVHDAFARFEITDEQGREVPTAKLPGKLARRGRPAPERLLRLRDGETGVERWLLVEATAIGHGSSGRSDLAVTVLRDVTERQRTQQAHRFLAEASDILGSSLNHHRTLQQMADLLVPQLADCCAVETVQPGGTIQMEALAHADRDKAEVIRQLREGVRVDPGLPAGVSQVVRSGRWELYADIDDVLVARHVKGGMLSALRAAELYSAMIVPMTARGRVIGAITMANAPPRRRFDERDVDVAEDLASRAAVAVDNALLYQARSQLARSLQRSLLPATPPSIPWAEVAARYRAGGDGVEVGGDFYDVFQVDLGTWAVVLGDVCGKGAEAAAITALARYSVRTAALSERRPGPVLSLLNGAIVGQLEDEASFFTAVYALLVRQEHGVRLSIARAGHPQPFVLRANGEVEPVAPPGPLLGVFRELDVPETSRILGPGDSLILYTDGLLEPDLEEEDLVGVLQSCAGLDPEQIATRLEEVALTRLTEQRDDVALLVLRVTAS